VTLDTVQRWVARAAGQRLDRVDWNDRPPIAHRIHGTDRETEELILTLRRQLKEQSERLERLEKSINDIVKQLRKTPTASQLKELEEMVEIYNPLKSSFITREQAEELIEERLR